MKTVNSELEELKAEIQKKNAELQAVRSELQKLRDRTLVLEDSRRAMLYMLEDLNETAAIVTLGKKEWEDTFDAISDPIFIHSMDFKLLRANRAYADAVGKPFADLIGKVYYEVFPTVDDQCKVCGCLTGSVKTEEEVFLPSVNKVFNVRCYPVRDAEGNLQASIHVMEDITERKQAMEENARLFEKIKEEAEVSSSLLTMGETLNTGLDERELVRNVMSLAPRYMKFDREAIFYYDESLNVFTFAGGYGMSPVEEGILLSKSFKEQDVPAIEGILRGEMVVLHNASEEEGINKEVVDLFHIGSAVIVPISFRGKMTGAIYADFKTVRAIEQRDISLLKGLADGIAVALQNSRLYRESVERMMELSAKVETIKTMAQLDKEILSSIDRSAILRTATAMVSRVIPSERSAIVLRENDGYRVVSEWGVGGLYGKTYPIEGSHFETFEKTRGSLFISDITAGDCPYHRDQSGTGIKSALVFPLVTKEGTIGFLDIGSSYYGRLTPEHLSSGENIASQISVALENARLYDDLQQLLIGTITSLASAIDAKSPWTNGHSERVTEYAVKIGRELRLKEHDLEWLRLSGLLHDVGKIGTYDIVLDKPGKLTDEEFDIVRKHPGKGAEILATIKQLIDVIPGVLHHHERYDGKGYPDGLKGEDIPIQARILCVADSFDSMTADRPYRKSPGREFAISELTRCSGTQFDTKVVEAFLVVLGRNSTGMPVGMSASAGRTD